MCVYVLVPNGKERIGRPVEVVSWYRLKITKFAQGVWPGVGSSSDPCALSCGPWASAEEAARCEGVQVRRWQRCWSS